jgi:hypothetical protein
VKKRLCAVALLVMLGFSRTPVLCVSASDPEPEDFLYTASATLTGERDYAAVRLTPEIFALARGDLSDIRLFADTGAGAAAVLPYFVNSFEVETGSAHSTYDMTMKDAFVKDNDQILDYALTTPQADDVRATAVHMRSGDEFVKQVALFGGYDGVHWEKITNATIYRAEGNEKLMIPLQPFEKYTWYRFVLAGEQDPVSFDDVWLEYYSFMAVQSAFIEEFSPPFSVEQDGKETVISLPGAKNLPLAAIELKTLGMFKREVSVEHIRQTLYNLRFGDAAYQNLSLSLSEYKSPPGGLEVRIENKDDAPISIDGVTLRYYTCDLVFEKPARGSVLLAFGNDGIYAPPEYDIAAYRTYILEGGYDALPLGAVFARPAEEPEEGGWLDPKIAFNVSVIAAAVILIAIILARLRRNP